GETGSSASAKRKDSLRQTRRPDFSIVVNVNGLKVEIAYLETGRPDSKSSKRDFEGGELCFPQLQVVVHLLSGQVVAFASRILLHGNFTVIKGIRHSIVYFVHNSFFHNLWDFDPAYIEAGIEKGNGPIVSDRALTNPNRIKHV
ncbi:19520_t:CDS:2, partial [Racocetra persica]